MTEPAGVLGEIARAKKRELTSRFDGVSLDGLRSHATPTRRSLAEAIAKPGSSFILEIKKASPSEGAIRLGADANALARSYCGVGDALSVLTDNEFFGGSIADLSAARSEFEGPILAKDFFIDRRQVAEARLAGADAVLVMLSLLDDARAHEIIDEAHRLGMEVLVEVHDEAEMRRALALRVPLIGINNRDLRDLSIDLSTTERLARLAPEHLLVSESGITGRGDVDRLSGHVNGFLVGSSLMRSPSPAQAARNLVFGRVKLCGLRTKQDIEAGRAAAFVGFVFVPGTPRHVTAQEAAPLAALARSFGVLPVGVFRDSPVPAVGEVAATLKLHAVQLHGREDDDYVRDLRPHLPGSCEIWTAISAGRQPLPERSGDRLVFDNGDGGTGRTFDWDQVRHHPGLPKALVAGGIGPGNARAAAALGGYALDVGSSLDSMPGVKSPEKIHSLFEALRPPCRERLRACA
ncbi:bifunctional indole-3-glycerol-phosphate synthase TrpC/phosphoribosylanthranilate isomerase TrpF [Sphingomonas sp.]|uniref:bifunctional indole-3-glycerol-phosphate synthase TrpC/phosphoribosylanthranilate isomerase TrpF n=1 Tax=Sphingomonas sp. TaxID=28214 RepID=UPI00182114C8|nr:bifunctional indole-3-glycerol-phosphate synthase TrpC/phosphoribosylanthranilate isomerase TrpF [Sphingomonas sp.]MBA3511459.1 bifunctional indole-3-glycerol-phosphate synthase TrpC/phosphoribosylanthranilate isomerase TrpF [Sphingomonas sp.]